MILTNAVIDSLTFDYIFESRPEREIQQFDCFLSALELGFPDRWSGNFIMEQDG